MEDFERKILSKRIKKRAINRGTRHTPPMDLVYLAV
jgi:hypothetical protein